MFVLKMSYYTYQFISFSGFIIWVRVVFLGFFVRFLLCVFQSLSKIVCVLNCVFFLMSKKKEPKGEGGIREESEKETSEIKREEGR